MILEPQAAMAKTPVKAMDETGGKKTHLHQFDRVIYDVGEPPYYRDPNPGKTITRIRLRVIGTYHP
jgi:hypothetical protein